MHITKNGITKKVTQGTYISHFRDMGWVPYNAHVDIQGSNARTEFLVHTNGNTAQRHVNSAPVVSENKTPDFDNMTYQQLTSFAKRNNVPLGKIRQKDEIVAHLKQEYSNGMA